MGQKRYSQAKDVKESTTNIVATNKEVTKTTPPLQASEHLEFDTDILQSHNELQTTHAETLACHLEKKQSLVKDSSLQQKQPETIEVSTFIGLSSMIMDLCKTLTLDSPCLVQLSSSNSTEEQSWTQLEHIYLDDGSNQCLKSQKHPHNADLEETSHKHQRVI